MNIEENGRGYLSLPAVLSAQNVCAQVKMLAMRAQTGDYIIPGQYLKNLNDLDLECLVNIADKCTFDDQALFNMVCLAEILSSTEGFPPLTDEEALKNVGFLITILTGIALERKGITTVVYDHISFAGSSESDVIIKMKTD